MSLKVDFSVSTTSFGGLLGVASVANVALLVIGICAVIGVFPGVPTLGWVTLGLGGGASLIALTAFGIKNHKFGLVLLFKAATFITIGILGGITVLSTAQVGWAIIGTYAAMIVLTGSLGGGYYLLRHRSKRIIN